MDVWLTPQNRWSGHVYRYDVIVDGKTYDTFFSTRWLTQSEMVDVAAGYREALES